MRAGPLRRLSLRASLCGAVLAASIPAAAAQTALDTVAFIVQLQEKGAKDLQGQVRYQFTATGDQLVVKDLAYPGGTQTYTYTQETACRYHLIGAATNDAGNRQDITIDFTRALLDRLHSRREQTPFNVNGSTLILTIPGVHICRAKGSSGLWWSEVDQGQCADQFNVDVYNPQVAGRVVNALKYLRADFCKGQAF